ncbi:MAG: DegT/DnrJ/EryC1/StrS family aminotransferase, partial [Myxococcales bacterium]|nr:DegT/DnrJ/EryC1/StrS family aminotransferase [Myxococcales bacterium]
HRERASIHHARPATEIDAAGQCARVIEDACHALGASYRGTRIGAGTSDAVVFSFHPVKHITTGEGGAVIVRDPDLQRRMERQRQHGIERDPARIHAPGGAWVYEVQELGWNYRLSDLACALGLSQLTKLDRFLAARRQLAAHYRTEITRLFGEDGGVTAPVELADRESAYHLFAVAIDFARYRTTRTRVMQALAAAEIGTQVHYIPLLHHTLHARNCPGELDRPRPGADHYYARTLSLPLYPKLTTDDVTYIVGALHRILGESARESPGESP